jgi:dTDP-4-dehydrorhamnose reductase
MKRILVCGSNGLLGQRVSLMLNAASEYEVLSTSRQRTFVFDDRLYDYTQLDITQKSDVKSLVSSFHPTVIVNAAGATDVDWCENHREEAWKANVVGVENLAEAARKVGATMIHVSSDYVFDGKNGPYDELARPNPISYYGKAKLAGENVLRTSGIPHAIVRTILVYGYGIGVRSNFALWVIENLKAGRQIRCVDDQLGNPTYVGDLAFSVTKIIEREREGLYHVCGAEFLSRFDFAVRAADVFSLDPDLITKTKSSDLQQVALRPLVTGFITLKAATELGVRPLNASEGLAQLKGEYHKARKI